MDVDRLAELLEEIELGNEPEAEGEESLLLAVASELKSLAPPTQISAEQEDRIFAKFLDLAPEAAPELDHELEKVAGVLGKLAPAAIEENLSEEAADRIFARIEERIPEIAGTKASWLSTTKLRLAAFAPRPLIQRQSDKLESLISDSRSGRKVQARGAMADLLTAAMSLQPAPAIEPSPSFVDWLEVRLMSPANQIEPAKSRFTLREAMHSTRFQTSLAGACAAMVALAFFNLGGDSAVRAPRNDTRIPAIAKVTPQEVDQPIASGGEIPQPLVPTVAAPRTGSRTDGRVNGPKNGNDGTNNNGDGGNGDDGGNGENDGSLSMAASSSGEALDRVQEFLNGAGGNP